MAKKQGIDDISKAIMAAIKAARKGGPKSIDVSDGVTKTYPKNQVKDPVFGMQKVKIDSGDAYRSYDKGTPEYNAAYKKQQADAKILKKVNKTKSDGSKNRAYKEALEAEKQADNWSRQADGGARNTKIVRDYLDPKKDKKAKIAAKKETWMMPDGELMPKKKAKKALKKYGPK